MDLREYLRAARLDPEKGDNPQYMTMADKMVSNVFVDGQRNSPVVCSIYNADVTRFAEAFDKLRAECDYKLTLNAVMLKVLVEGLKAAPRLNAHFKYNHTTTAGQYIIKKHIDVSMAVCKEDGGTFQMKLLQLEDKSLKEIALMAADARKRLDTADLEEVMFEASRQHIIGEMSKGNVITPLRQALNASFGTGKVVSLSKTLKSDFLKIIGKKDFQPDSGIRVEEVNQGTVCFTNWGAICESTGLNVVSGPLLYPQVFLFSMGRLREEKFVYEDESGNLRLGTKKILPLGLNFDHKIGGVYELTPFIRRIEEIFGNPEAIYSW